MTKGSALTVLIFVALASVPRGQSTSAAATGSPETIFFAPNAARTITLSKQGVILASFTVGAGTAISVGWTNGPYTRPDPDGRFEVHGDVEIRLQPVSQRDPAVKLEQAMLQSPLTLTGRTVDLVINR
jgi:hypothetical protein